MNRIPKGMISALPTPFFPDETINFSGYKKLIDYVIDGGIHCILAGGSTGEYHMMTLQERKDVIKAACEYADGRVPVMAGTGCYTPKATIELCNYAAECGAAWGLVLPPYYQQTSREGIIEFYREIAEGSKVGIVVYNNPGATNVDLDPQLCYELSKIDNVVSLKDTEDLLHTCEVVALTRDNENFSVLTGYEHLIIPALSIGADGATGIAHNIIPKEIVKIYDLVTKDNDVKAAAEVNAKLTDLYKYMELEPYPGPVKAGMDALGLEGGVVRKPLTQTSNELRGKIKNALKDLGYSV